MFETVDARALRAWLLGHVCPYWAERIVDPRGGYFEGLDASGKVAHAPQRTVLNQARLTYVFSHAAVLGAGPAMLEAACHGCVTNTRFRRLQPGIFRECSR